MESKLKDFVSTFKKQNKPKIITVADMVKDMRKKNIKNDRATN